MTDKTVEEDRVADVQEALRKKYAPPEWLLFFELRNQTGYGKGTVRYADAMAFNLFPSRGQEIHGFEFKRTRKDFLRELKDPEKSADLQKYCDRWWIIALDNEVVRPSDAFPPTWGLLVLNSTGSQLIVRTKAPKLESAPVDRHLLCSVLRGASDMLANPDQSAVAQARKIGHRSGFEAGRQYALKDSKDNVEELTALRQVIDDFKAKTGIDILHYTAGEQFNQAIRRVRALRDVNVVAALRRLNSFVTSLKDNVEAEVELLLQLGAQEREIIEGTTNGKEQPTVTDDGDGAGAGTNASVG
jgi:hypothetical protein